MKKLTSILSIVALSASVTILSVEAHSAKKLRVLGLPISTGLIQKEKEQPFFEDFAAKTGIDKFTIQYTPIDATGIKPEDTLRVLRNGTYDIVAIRAAQAAQDDPFLLGLDIVGLSTDYAKARKVYAAYKDAFDVRLQEKSNAKLLGLWPFGPQIIFSKDKLTGLSDLKGKKVRVYDQSLAKFMESLGAIPVNVRFPEVQQALSRGVVDVAITGASSANSAGWPEVTKYMMPLGFQVSYNGYAINLKVWNSLSEQEQSALQEAFDKLNASIWEYSEYLSDDAFRCNTGKTPCETVKQYQLKEIPVTEADLKIVAEGVKNISFPTWSKTCNSTWPQCKDKWLELLGEISGIK